MLTSCNLGWHVNRYLCIYFLKLKIKRNCGRIRRNGEITWMKIESKSDEFLFA